MLQTVAAAEPFVPDRPRSQITKRVVVYVLLACVAALFFVPFIWSVVTSFKTIPDAVHVTLIPHPFTVEGWRELWTQYDFKLYLRNSLFLAAVVTASNMFLGALGGYAFARLRFPGRELLFLLVLGTLMIPDQLRLIPVFVLLTKWHLVGGFWGYILISLVTATNLFFMRQYFLTIPRDYEEAAKLDGAGYFKTFWKVMLPLAGPALAAVTILEFQGIWNDFFWPFIILGFGNPDNYTLTMGIVQFVFQYQTDWPPLMAASVIAILPIGLLFVFFQRYFVAGVVASGVKG
jgi:multiple sugar transport system permease protein